MSVLPSGIAEQLLLDLLGCGFSFCFTALTDMLRSALLSRGNLQRL